MKKSSEAMLSLVVPVYGVEKYIYKFLNSLEKNLQPGVEVLIINDGTKDKSIKISEEFTKNNNKYIKILNKANGGVSSARNKGLEFAKGEYIIFADPDDVLAKDYVSVILNAIDKYNRPDRILFEYYVGSDERGFKHVTVHDFSEGLITKERYIREQIKDIDITGSVCTKVIKRSLFEGLWFDEDTRCAEDYELLTELSLRFERIAYIPKPIYYYVMRKDSITHTVSEKDSLKFRDLVFERQFKHSQVYQCLSIYAPVRVCLSFLLRRYKGEKIDNIGNYKKFINQNIKNIIFSGDFDVNEKKQGLLVFFNLAKLYYGIKYKK